MTKPRFGSFTLRTDCTRCGQPIPVNAPTQRAHCSYCQNDVPLPDSIWWHVLGKFDDEHHALRNGHCDSKTVDVGGFTIHYEYTRIAEAPKAVTSLDAPTWLRDLVNNARAIYVSDASAIPNASSGGAIVATTAVKPVLMTCPQCGGALHITTDTERTTTCKFCNADFYLPDDLWRRLHPVKVVEPWMVRFEGSTRRDDREDAALAERRRKEGEARIRTEREQFQQGDAVARDATVSKARRNAMVAVSMAYVTMVVSLAISVAVISGDVGVDLDNHVCHAGVVLTMLVASVALFLGVRVISLRLGPKNDAPLPMTWIMLYTGLFAPIINHSVIVLLAWSGGLHGKRDDAGTVTAKRREAMPIALLFLGLVVWWPLTLYCLIELK